jgi:DNA polymerase-3 subunit delta'
MKFSEIIGHEAIKDNLRHMVDTDTLPHAIMLGGMPGVQKLALARAFANYVHCTNRHDGDSCGECPACKQHASFNFPDMLYVFPVTGTKDSHTLISDDYTEQWHKFLTEYPLAPYEKWLELMNAENSQPQIKVAESAEIIRKMTLSNYLADQKIMIIWLPEKLQPAAANKLLKLIEEPTPGNMFIFVSNAPNLVLPTIFSRTRPIDVHPLGTEEIATYLRRHYSIDDNTAYEEARNAEGSLIKATESISLSSEQHLFRKLFQEVMRKAYIRDVFALKDWSEEVAALKREKSRRFLAYCARMVRENFLYNLNRPQLLTLNSEDEAFSRKFAPFIHAGNVEGLMTEIDNASRDIAGNANAKIVFFDFALQLILLIKIPK